MKHIHWFYLAVAFLAVDAGIVFHLRSSSLENSTNPEVRNDLTISAKTSLTPEIWKALDESPHMTIYSLDPNDRPSYGRAPGDNTLQGYTVLGKTAIPDVATRQHIVSNLREAIAASGGAYACFNPRHGIRVMRDAITYDLVICFECQAVHAFVNNVDIASTPLNGSSQVLDAILSAAHIPLPPSSQGTN